MTRLSEGVADDIFSLVYGIHSQPQGKPSSEPTNDTDYVNWDIECKTTNIDRQLKHLLPQKYEKNV